MRQSILYVIDGFRFGGGERVFLQLIEGLKDDYDISVAGAPGGIFQEKVQKNGVPYYPLKMEKQLSIKPIIEIRKIIKRQRIQLVNSQGARADHFARIACGSAIGVPNICTLAMPVEGFDVKPWRKEIYKLVDRTTSRYVSRFIVVSNALKNRLLQRHSLPEHKIVRIYNGIELNRYYRMTDSRSIRKELGLANDILLIGAIGRMVWQKGFEYLIAGMPEVLRCFPNAKFLFVGDGPLLERLQQKARKKGVAKNVVFTGYRSDVKDILAVLDILAVPSLLEGFPMVILEAMAMETPIVATSIAGINEQITNGHNGMLVRPKSSHALAAEIIKTLNTYEFRRNMGRAARKTVEQHFSVEKMIDRTIQVYSSVLRKP